MALKHKIDKLRNSKDGKVLVQNFAYLSLLQVAAYVFPLVTLPYLARVIGLARFGDIAFAAAIVLYFNTTVAWGFDFTATRDVAKNRDDINKVSKIFSNVISAKFLLLICCALLFYLGIEFIPYLNERKLLLWFTFLHIPGNVLFPEWLFQGLEKMKYITIINVIAKLLFTVLVFFVIKEEKDFIYQPVLLALGAIISGGIAMYLIFRKLNMRFIMPRFSEIFAKIKESFNMFVSLLLPNLYSNLSVILLEVFGGSIATGIYSSGKKIIDLCDQFTLVLSRTFFPFLARRLDKHHIYVKISGAFSIVVGIALFVLADVIVKILYTDDFAASAIVIRIMAIAPFFFFLNNTYGPNYLVLRNKEHILRNIILCCSLGGFVLAWLGVIWLGYIGVALTITIVWGVRGMLTYYYANKVKKQNG